MQEPSSIRRVSWVVIKESKMLMLRKPGGSLFFDPGGKCPLLKGVANRVKLQERVGKADVTQGDFDRLMLKRKLRQDLNIELDESNLERLTSFRAPAIGKPEGTMVEQHCYWSHYSGGIESTAKKEVGWFGKEASDKPRPFSDAAEALYLRILQEGLFE